MTRSGRGCKKESVNGEEKETSSERTRGQHGELEELEERDGKEIIPAGGVLSSKESGLVGQIRGRRRRECAGGAQRRVKDRRGTTLKG